MVEWRGDKIKIQIKCIKKKTQTQNTDTKPQPGRVLQHSDSVLRDKRNIYNIKEKKDKLN